MYVKLSFGFWFILFYLLFVPLFLFAYLYLDEEILSICDETIQGGYKDTVGRCCAPFTQVLPMVASNIILVQY